MSKHFAGPFQSHRVFSSVTFSVLGWGYRAMKFHPTCQLHRVRGEMSLSALVFSPLVLCVCF